MSKYNIADCDRRSVLVAGGALMLGAALWPLRSLAQGAGDKLRIGVIGSGKIGGTIGGLWVKAGHSVLFSSRHPEELKDLVAGLGALAQAGTVEQAIAFGDVIFVAVPYGAIPQIGKDYAAALKNKIVLDACNAVAARDGAIAEEVEHDGIGVTSQKYLAGTRLVRGFQYDVLHDLRARGEPSRSQTGDPDCRRRCRSGQGRGRFGARCGLRSGRGRQAGRCAPVSARQSGIRPASERRRAQAKT